MLQLDELKQQWTEDSIIDSEDLSSASLYTANLHQKYLNILTEYKLRLFKLDKEYLLLKGMRMRYYNGQLTREELLQNRWSPYPYKTPLKSELEKLLETDEHLLALTDKQSYLKFCFEYCEEVMKALRDRNWIIRNTIEIRKFEAGI